MYLMYAMTSRFIIAVLSVTVLRFKIVCMSVSCFFALF